MIGVNALSGGGGGIPQASLWDRTTGTNIGNMVNGGGLAAAFDGTTSQLKAACATKTNATGWVGKTLGGGSFAIDGIVVYPSSDNGFQHDNQAAETFTLQLYGKQGVAPGSDTDGTLLGTATGSDTAPATQTIASSDKSTLWAHVWVRNVPAAGDSQIAELQINYYP